MPVDAPPLGQRREDIRALVDYLIDRLNREQGLPKRHVSDDAIAVLQAYEWPGNVRQLKNIVERIMILGDGTSEIGPDDLPAEVTSDASGGVASGGGENFVAMPLREAREAFERNYLIAQINRFGGNVSRTASFVGMERSALHRKLKALGVSTANRNGGRAAYIENVVELSS